MKKLYFIPFVLVLFLSTMVFSRFSIWQNIKGIDINEVSSIDFQNNKNVLLDVRTQNEFKEGHLPNSINIDVMNSEFNNSISLQNKEKNYYIYCRSGTRSLKAYSMMKNLGFKNLTNLEGGILAYKGTVEKF